MIPLEKYLLGVDFGTYSTKGSLCDLKGNLLATSVCNHEIISPKPGFAEHNPITQWWKEFIWIVKDLKQKANINSSQFACIGISAIMAAVTPVDENINPLRNAILYGIDNRSTQQADELNNEIGKDKITSISGSPCTYESFGPKIKWIKDNEPEVFSKTKHINFAPGFITAKLTGKYAIDRHSIQSCQPMIDTRNLNYSWNEEMCSYVCPSSMLPEIRNTTDVIGNVKKEVAIECGIDEGVPVICGTTDAAAEAFSVGILEPGDTLLMYGSSAFLINISSTLIKDTPYPGAPYLLDGLIDNCLGMGTAGSLTMWLKNVIAKDLLEKENSSNINSFDELFKEAEGIPVGSNGLIVLPYFQGKRLPVSNPYAKGMIFGLSLNHTRGDIVHAFFEGIGFGMSQMLSTINSCSKIKNLIATGGGTKTPLWLQIVSDISGMKQKVPKIKIGASYGDALLAGVGIGKLKSPEEIKRLVKFDYEVLPNFKNNKEYKKYESFYSELYLNTKDIMKKII